MSSKAKKGIDISYCQQGLDLADAKKAGVEFAVIRAGYSLSTDRVMDTHVKGAEKNGIPYGFYWYSRAFSTAEAKSEAKACITAIKGCSPAYPVFYDMEDKDQIEGLTREQRTDIICVFCEEIKKAGYPAGVYLNPSWMENYVDKSRLIGNYEIWLAHWTENPDVPSSYDYGQVMWQWGLDSIGKFKVDGDLCFKDYTEKKPEKPAVPFEPAGKDKEERFAVGAVVKFSGGRQYGASCSDTGYPANAGLVKITLKADGAPHPYHVISEDGSGVYGWVNADTLSECQEKNAESEVSGDLSVNTQKEPSATVSKKTIDQLANEVIAGLWGNGLDRVNRLTAAGYDYTIVQNRVNEILKK